jgi:hypothetical protein
MFAKYRQRRMTIKTKKLRKEGCKPASKAEFVRIIRVRIIFPGIPRSPSGKPAGGWLKSFGLAEFALLASIPYNSVPIRFFTRGCSCFNPALIMKQEFTLWGDT